MFLVPVLIVVPPKHLALSLMDPKMWKFSCYGGKKCVDQPRAGQSDREPSGRPPSLLPRMPKERVAASRGPLPPRATGQPSGMSETVPSAHPISILEEALGTQLH